MLVAAAGISDRVSLGEFDELFPYLLRGLKKRKYEKILVPVRFCRSCAGEGAKVD
jgi:hypothetical protein